MSHLWPIQVMKSNESIVIFFLIFLVQAPMFPCIDTTRAPLCTLPSLLTLHWPYYPTTEGSHSGNIWLVLNNAKIYFDLKKKKCIQNFFQYLYHVFHISHFFLVWFSWFQCWCASVLHMFVFIDKILINMTDDFNIKSGLKLLEI